MILLENGATAHAAFLFPASPGMKAHGLVLAEDPTQWITWNVYNDFDTADQRWDAETGHYFQKNLADAKQLAEFDFGIRLVRFLPYQVHLGVRHGYTAA